MNNFGNLIKKLLTIIVATTLLAGNTYAEEETSEVSSSEQASVQTEDKEVGITSIEDFASIFHAHEACKNNYLNTFIVGYIKPKISRKYPNLARNQEILDSLTRVMPVLKMGTLKVIDDPTSDEPFEIPVIDNEGYAHVNEALDNLCLWMRAKISEASADLISGKDVIDYASELQDKMDQSNLEEMYEKSVSLKENADSIKSTVDSMEEVIESLLNFKLLDGEDDNEYSLKFLTHMQNTTSEEDQKSDVSIWTNDLIELYNTMSGQLDAIESKLAVKKSELEQANTDLETFEAEQSEKVAEYKGMKDELETLTSAYYSAMNATIQQMVSVLLRQPSGIFQIIDMETYLDTLHIINFEYERLVISRVDSPSVAGVEKAHEENEAKILSAIEKAENLGEETIEDFVEGEKVVVEKAENTDGESVGQVSVEVD